MKKITIAFLSCILLCSFAIKSFAQQDQRIKAAYMLAYGRTPSQGELNYWLGRGNLSIDQLIEFHRNYLPQDANNHQQVIIQSYIDALGRRPSDGEVAFYMKYTQTYTELMASHVNWLKSNPGEYDKVINISYGQVATQKEMNFWRAQEVHPCFLLIAYHQDYARKQQSEVTSQGAVNLQNLGSVTAVSLSPAVAAEASKFISHNGSAILSPNSSNLVAQGAGNLVAQGAGNLVAQGAGNFIAVGAR
ncbi:MAG: hypothetical protein M3004_00590 [Bacteroidota bacterium]|nr:hypothetical protein [Bacteroidota bacterium]